MKKLIFGAAALAAALAFSLSAQTPFLVRDINTTVATLPQSREELWNVIVATSSGVHAVQNVDANQALIIAAGGLWSFDSNFEGVTPILRSCSSPRARCARN